MEKMAVLNLNLGMLNARAPVRVWQFDEHCDDTLVSKDETFVGSVV